jgi:hypothetical protein
VEFIQNRRNIFDQIYWDIVENVKLFTSIFKDTIISSKYFNVFLDEIFNYKET